MNRTVFHNGRIISTFLPLKVHEAMIVIDGRIEDIGENHAILSRAADLDVPLVDLKGRTVMPGFIDAHMHLDELGEYLNIIDLRGINSIEALKSKIEENRDRFDEWILGHGWDQELFKEKRWPTRFDLDEVVNDKPVVISRLDLHSAVMNTKALSLLKISEKYSDSNDAVKDKNGRLTGVVKEHPFEESRNVIRSLTSDRQLENYLVAGMKEALSKGVTTLGFVSCSLRVLGILRKLRDSGKLKGKIRVYANPEDLNALKDFPDDDHLKVNGIKLFVDGSLGSRTALLSTPYFDDSSTSGEQVIETGTLKELCQAADSMGFHIATHAIGDKGLDIVLDAYSGLKNNHRIEHGALIREEQFAKIRETSTAIVTQPHFIITDFWVLERVGKDRSNYVYPLKRLINEGIDMAFSTDTPVELIDPWPTVYAAVTRGEFDNTEFSELTRDQKLTISEALNAYTRKASEVIRDNGIGSLEVGKSADFIVLDMDPFNVGEEKLEGISVLETYVSGEKVFEK